MSSSFDILQRGLHSLEGDHAVMNHLRWMIDDLHDADHEQEGALNRRRRLGAHARDLERRLKQLEDQGD